MLTTIGAVGMLSLIMKVYRTTGGIVAEEGSRIWILHDQDWDEIFILEGLVEYLESKILGKSPDAESWSPEREDILAPLSGQEVWAAGVTYYRSRNARIVESKESDSGSFYDRVYDAERPELFFKGNARTVVGPGQEVRIRSDSGWNVPEPELTLAINRRGEIIGCTVGNDMSSRDIEGSNPLYLPQAKIYNGSCALGPGILLGREKIGPSTEIALSIRRGGDEVFTGKTTLKELKRSPESLVTYLFRDNDFPLGCFLMTGTGIVPPDAFTLQSGDTIVIDIEAVGTLTNTVA